MKRLFHALLILWLGATFLWAAPTSAPPPPKALKAYFWKHNKGLENQKIGRTVRRSVGTNRKQAVLMRDDWTCQICKKRDTENMEVDHAIALQNGGKNAQTNLFTLCPGCHDHKTELDIKLRERRELLSRRR